MSSYIFQDYDGRIKYKKNLLIDGYVKQYGEEYRSFLSEKFDHIQRCIFENPRRIQAYLRMQSMNLGKQLTLKILKDINIDISKIESDENGRFFSKDSAIQKTLDAFFPETGYISLSNTSDGLFSFMEPYDEKNIENLQKRANVLVELKLIPNIGEIMKFAQTNQYQEVESTIRTLLRSTVDCLKEQKKKGMLFEEFSNSLALQEKAIIEKEEALYIQECKQYVYDHFPGMPLMRFNHSRFFSQPVDLESPENLPLAAGTLEYFLPEYTEELRKSKNEARKKEIYSKRWKYLNDIGVYKGSFNVSDEQLLLKNWYEIPGLKDKLPDISLVEHLKKLREKHQNACMLSLAQTYTMNDYKIREEELTEPVKKTLFFATDEYRSHCSKSLTVFLCPKDGYSEVLDFTIDRQIRRALEYFVKFVKIGNEVPFLKPGTILEEVKSGISFTFLKHGNEIGMCNEAINEIHAQKLSIESTLERYQRGEFILVPPDEARYVNTSAYDSLITIFDRVFSADFQKIMVDSRMEPIAPLPMYEIVGQKVLSDINDRIINLNPITLGQLQQLGEKINLAMAEEVATEQAAMGF